MLNPCIRVKGRKASRFALDEFRNRKTVAAAYSLRKLNSNSTRAIRVRRSSDNAEMDIGFVGENLDVATLLSFVGAGNSGFVTTWYDLSGNQNFAIQSTAANQPRIVNAGIIDRDFDATKCALLYPTFASASGVTLVSNGNFVNTASWSTIGGAFAWSVSGNEAIITNLSANASNYKVYQNITAVVGRRYYLSVDMLSNSSSDGVSLGASGNQRVSHSGSGSYETLKLVWTATLTGLEPRVLNTSRTGDISANPVKIKNIVLIDVTELGQPILYFDGTNDVLTIANSASVDILSAPLMLNAVFNTVGAQAGYVISKNSDASANVQYGIILDQAQKYAQIYLEGSSRQLSAANSISDNTQKVYSGVFENGAQQGYVNGTASGSAGNYNSTLTSRANMNIGARSNNAGGTAWATFYKGNISEIIITKNTSVRSKAERNQGKYYGQTVT